MNGPYSYSSSRKRLVMAVVVQLVRQLPRRYYAKRGSIQWGTHDFDSLPLACAVHCETATFLRDAGQNEGTVTLEMFGKVPQPDVLSTLGIDDDAIDDMTEDASAVFELLELAEDEGSSVITMIDRSAAEITEVADVLRGVQGVVATARVTF